MASLSRRDPTDELDLLALARTVRDEVPLMMAISLATTLACAATAIVALTVAPIAPFVAALTLGPVWIGAVAASIDAVDGNPTGLRGLLSAVRRHARTGIALTSVPAVVASALLGSLAISNARPDQRWLLAPIALDAILLAVVALGCVTIFPLALVSRLRGRDRWLAALALAGRDLTTTLGIVALIVLMALSTRLVGPSPALLLAGPLAMLSTLTVRRPIAFTSREDHP